MKTNWFNKVRDERFYAAWAAGVVDGEGCITIKKRTQKSKVYYTLCVTVSQSGLTRPRMISCLFDVFGGYVCDPTPDPRGGHRLPRWEWYTVCEGAEQFLRRVAPFLVQKQEQAQIALEYRQRGVGRGKQALAFHYYQILAQTKNYHRSGHGVV